MTMNKRQAAVLIQSNWRGHLGRQRYFSELLAQERNRVKSTKKIKQQKLQQVKHMPMRSNSRDSLDGSPTSSCPPSDREEFPNEEEPQEEDDAEVEEDIIVYRANKKAPIVKASQITTFSYSPSDAPPSLKRSSQASPMESFRSMPQASRSNAVELSSDSLNEDFPLDKIEEEDEILRDSLANTREQRPVPTISLAKSASLYQSRSLAAQTQTISTHSPSRRMQRQDRPERARTERPQEEEGVELGGAGGGDSGEEVAYLEELDEDEDCEDSLELPVQRIIKRNIAQAPPRQPRRTPSPPPKKNAPAPSPAPAQSSGPRGPGSQIPRFPSAKKTRPSPLAEAAPPPQQQQQPPPTKRQPQQQANPSPNHNPNPLAQIVDVDKFERLKRMYEESAALSEIRQAASPKNPPAPQSPPPAKPAALPASRQAPARDSPAASIQSRPQLAQPTPAQQRAPQQQLRREGPRLSSAVYLEEGYEAEDRRARSRQQAERAEVPREAVPLDRERRAQPGQKPAAVQEKPRRPPVAEAPAVIPQAERAAPEPKAAPRNAPLPVRPGQKAPAQGQAKAQHNLSSSEELERKLLREIAQLNQKQSHLINHLFDGPAHPGSDPPQPASPQRVAGNAQPNQPARAKNIPPAEKEPRPRRGEADPLQQKEKRAFGPGARDFRPKEKEKEKVAAPSNQAAQIVKEWQQAALRDQQPPPQQQQQQQQPAAAKPGRHSKAEPPQPNAQAHAHNHGSPDRLAQGSVLQPPSGPNPAAQLPLSSLAGGGYLQHFDQRHQFQQRSLSAQRGKRRPNDPADSRSEGGYSQQSAASAARHAKESASLPPLLSDQRLLQQQVVAQQGGHRHPLEPQHTRVQSRQSTRSAPAY